MTTFLSPSPKLQFFGSDGTPLVGGKLYSYAAGTSTPLATYTDSSQTTANPNPIILDSRGEANVWLTAVEYKFVLKTSNDSLIWTVDNVSTLQGVIDAYEASLAASSGSSLIGFIQSGANATARTVQAKLRDFVNVADFGAVGDGAHNDTTAIQAAIDSVSANGGTVYFNPGKYLITDTLIANKGVLLNGQNRTDLSANTNGGGENTASPIIVWGGSSGISAYMFKMQPESVGDVIWGGGAVYLEWDGGEAASGAVIFDNTKYSRFNGKIRNVTYAGLIVNSTSGVPSNFSMNNQIESLEFIWGAVTACQDAHGLILAGNGSDVPATQQYVGDVSGLVYNGSLVRVSETDNAQFQSIHGVVQSGGTGAALTLLNVGVQPASNNYFEYVNGPVEFDNGLKGNFFNNYNSEGGGFTQLAGSSSWDGDLLDYVSGERFMSHKWALRDKISLKNADFVGDSGMTVVPFGLQWNCLAYSASSAQIASCIIPAPYWLADGSLEGLEVIVGSNGTSGGNYVIKASLSAGTNSAIVVTPDQTQTQTLAAGAQYTPTTYTFNFGATPQYFTKDDHIFVTISRLGNDAADTNTDPMVLLGVRVMYVGDGPNSPGSGTYYIPAWN